MVNKHKAFLWATFSQVFIKNELKKNLQENKKKIISVYSVYIF